MKSMDKEEKIFCNNQNSLSDDIAAAIVKPEKSEDQKVDEPMAKKDKKEKNNLAATVVEVHIASSNVDHEQKEASKSVPDFIE